MLVASIFFWESFTNIFHLPYGMITLTLFDMASIVGLRPIGKIFDPTLMNKTKPNFTFSPPSYITFMKYHYASTNNVNTQEHVTFLTCWKSHYVFCSNSIQVSKKLIPLVTQFHERRNIYLSKLILCSLYESLAITSRDLKARVDLDENFLISGPIWILQLWLSSTFDPSLKVNASPDPDRRIKG